MRRTLFGFFCYALLLGPVHASEHTDAFHAKVGDSVHAFDAVSALPMPSGEVVGVVEYPQFPPHCADIKCILLKRYDANGVLLASRVKASNLYNVTGAAVDHHGRIVVVGSTSTPGVSGHQFAVLRFKADLTDDTTFGANGRAVVDFEVGVPNNDEATAVSVDAQDRIVVVGSVSRSAPGDIDFGIARLRASDGALDPTFGSAGRTVVFFDLGPVDRYEFPQAVAIGAGGKIVVGGIANDSTTGSLRAVLARLTTNGSLDSNFCAPTCNYNPYPAIHSGRRVYYFGSGTVDADYISGVDVAANGDIVAAGSHWFGGVSQAAIVRFSASGDEMNEKLESGSKDYARYMAVRFADSLGTRILAAGHTESTEVITSSYFMVQAFTSTLGFDSSYGSCMTNTSAVCFSSGSGGFDSGISTAKSLELDALGRPLFSGNYGSPTSADFHRITNLNGPLP